MSEARCPMCGFIFTRRWLYYLTRLTRAGVAEINRQRPRFHPKHLTPRYLIVACEECRFIYPQKWDIASMSWSAPR